MSETRSKRSLSRCFSMMFYWSRGTVMRCTQRIKRIPIYIYIYLCVIIIFNCTSAIKEKRWLVMWWHFFLSLKTNYYQPCTIIDSARSYVSILTVIVKTNVTVPFFFHQNWINESQNLHIFFPTLPAQSLCTVACGSRNSVRIVKHIRVYQPTIRSNYEPIQF